MDGYTHGGTYTDSMKGYKYGRDIHTEGNAHEGTYIRRDIHRQGHSQGWDIHTEKNMLQAIRR